MTHKTHTTHGMHTTYTTHNTHTTHHALLPLLAQTHNWHSEPELMKKIIEFYTKAKAYKQLGMFYDACSQLEIDEFRDYDKALRSSPIPECPPSSLSPRLPSCPPPRLHSTPHVVAPFACALCQIGWNVCVGMWCVWSGRGDGGGGGERSLCCVRASTRLVQRLQLTSTSDTRKGRASALKESQNQIRFDSIGLDWISDTRKGRGSALKESQKYLVKAGLDTATLERRIERVQVLRLYRPCVCVCVLLECLLSLAFLLLLSDISRTWYACIRVRARAGVGAQEFVEAKAQVKDKPNEFVRVCMQLLEAPRLEAAVQVRLRARMPPHVGAHVAPLPRRSGGGAAREAHAAYAADRGMHARLPVPRPAA